MRAFLAAVLAALVITGVAAYVLERFQSGADVANTATGVRVDFAKKSIE